MARRRSFLGSLLAFVSAACRAKPASVSSKPPSIVLIAIDDLNDWVGHLGGHPQAATPNIDQLARQGVAFTHAYSPSPLCTPSRLGLMTGLRPEAVGMVGSDEDWPAFPNVPTLPQYFMTLGYHVAGTGKIYHERHRRESDWHEYFNEGRNEPVPPDGGQTVGPLRFAALDADDERMRDFAAVRWAGEKLLQRRDKPLFLCCGIHKPHLPWFVPRKYYDRHPLARVLLPDVRPDDLADVPHPGRMLADPEGLHAAVLRAGRWREAVQAYLAATSFADAMVGRLMSDLERSPDRANTIVVLTSDNGWHLGEKQHWRKFTLWEESTRVPLVMVAPGMAPAGVVCTRAVDLTSVYHTLTDLVNVPSPPHVEGKSLQALVRQPSGPWTTPAITSYHGHFAVRTEKWRYILYTDGSEELYDEEGDPQEWTNLAGRSEHAARKAELRGFIPREGKRPV